MARQVRCQHQFDLLPERKRHKTHASRCFTIEQAMKAQMWGSRGIVLLFL